MLRNQWPIIRHVKDVVVKKIREWYWQECQVIDMNLFVGAVWRTSKEQILKSRQNGLAHRFLSEQDFPVPPLVSRQ